MVTVSQIGWGSYMAHEGPYFRGVRKFALPADADETDKILAVIAAAEGGCYDSLNMYDRGIVSVGLIQWIEMGQRSVSDMIGAVADKCGIDYVNEALKPALKQSGATFKNVSGKWRFVTSGGAVVDNDAAARQLFLLCDGKKGSWDDNSKFYAKTWAAALANLWISDDACKAQSEYTRARLNSFVRKGAKEIMFDGTPNDGWAGMLRAAFYSYAINLPAVANSAVENTAKKLKHPKWSEQWCIGMLRAMTYDAKIGIYPARYANIKQTLEQCWDVKLPSAKELSDWKEPAYVPPVIEEIAPPKEALPIELPVVSIEVENKPVIKEQEKQSPFAFLLFIIQFIISLFSSRK